MFYLNAFESGWGSVESVVELIGELLMFSPVKFAHHLSHSLHGGPGRTQNEKANTHLAQKQRFRNTLCKRVNIHATVFCTYTKYTFVKNTVLQKAKRSLHFYIDADPVDVMF